MEFQDQGYKIRKSFALKLTYPKEIIESWLFHSSIICGAKIEISGTKWVEKTPIYIFSTFGSKMNEFERKK